VSGTRAASADAPSRHCTTGSNGSPPVPRSGCASGSTGPFRYLMNRRAATARERLFQTETHAPWRSRPVGGRVASWMNPLAMPRLPPPRVEGRSAAQPPGGESSLECSARSASGLRSVQPRPLAERAEHTSPPGRCATDLPSTRGGGRRGTPARDGPPIAGSCISNGTVLPGSRQSVRRFLLLFTSCI